MNTATGCLLAWVLCAGFGMSAALAAPRRVQVEKRADNFSTETQKAVIPEMVPLERNEGLIDKRFETSTIERQEALLGERRSTIELKEGKEKKMFQAPENKKFETIERKESAWAGKKSRYSTSEDAYRSKVATRFQEKIGEASPFAGEVKPVVSQRTTFDRVNRFVFQRDEDETTKVTTAGGGTPPVPIPDNGTQGGGAAAGSGTGGGAPGNAIK